MDLPWGDWKTRKFTTNVGLITSNGPYGHNIEAVEWTHHISYSPGLIAVNIHFADATNKNIKKTKVFGVNLCSTEQNIVASVAGGSSGKDVDKIKVLQELGYEFYKGKKIDVLMLKGASMNAECRVIKAMDLGDHTMFVGEVVEASGEQNKASLIYHDGKYWKVGEQLHKPEQEILDQIARLVEKHKKR